MNCYYNICTTHLEFELFFEQFVTDFRDGFLQKPCWPQYISYVNKAREEALMKRNIHHMKSKFDFL